MRKFGFEDFSADVFIRASERRIWQQITDIYAECSTDYDKNSPTTRDFYAMIQNRFHYAITGQTAAEIVYSKADHTKDHMGLTTWKNAPDGRVLKSDVSIAKNYLQEKDIRQLERAVSSYFDYIENQIERHNAFNMKQFAASVNKFLTFNDYQTLPSYFNDNVIIENHARNGRSTRTFISEGRWDFLINRVSKGDFVIIQFGHNDQSKKKADRYTTPELQYQTGSP